MSPMLARGSTMLEVAKMKWGQSDNVLLALACRIVSPFGVVDEGHCTQLFRAVGVIERFPIGMLPVLAGVSACLYKT